MEGSFSWLLELLGLLSCKADLAMNKSSAPALDCVINV